MINSGILFNDDNPFATFVENHGFIESVTVQ